MPNFEYSNSPWDYILPDGPAFCHWGGKKTSQTIIDILEIDMADRVLDVCSGQCGTLAILSQQTSAALYAVDNSKKALQHASRHIPNLRTFCCDAFLLPFKDSFFDKVFSQDPDVLLYDCKQAVFDEIYCVLKNGSLFVMQMYAQTPSINSIDRRKMDGILADLGYIHRDVCSTGEIPELIKKSGFSIVSFKDIHSIYASDNLVMLQRFEKYKDSITEQFPDEADKINRLLRFQKELFDKGSWTGVIAVAKK